MTVTMLYESTADDSARFLLGTVGTNPLVCVGVNPSTATPEKLDRTVTRVARYAELNDHDSWAMLNLYPQRSTDPTGMHVVHLPELKAANEQFIAEFIGGRKLTLLAAWGGLITTRPYLRGMLESIVEITDASSCDWQSIGGLLTGDHPRHPSRGAYLDLQPFNIDAYLRRL
ncbi:DUF1643 domain-containing protein [Cryobacterium psychrophilum]|uniref:DUF1643 domain-containing protein n=1 Tax=Cryobacterium psychrophilum TaxID=41988 RepID=A0A4Y8KIB6_9MICO|nr:DUF1643 domain-containing protein [Cryobacterium psychrophilum]TFD75320.1 DUF1643 domain-containing protein [Cryobacterium psychrophilum]